MHPNPVAVSTPCLDVFLVSHPKEQLHAVKPPYCQFLDFLSSLQGQSVMNCVQIRPIYTLYNYLCCTKLCCVIGVLLQTLYGQVECIQEETESENEGKLILSKKQPELASILPHCFLVSGG
jgi:hypothetical protein